MAHPRKLLRYEFVARLMGASTLAGARVSATRVDGLRKGQIPAISVYTLRESNDVDLAKTAYPRELTRTIDVEVTAWVPHTDALSADDAMDDIAEQIEAVIDADPYLGGLAGDCILKDTTMQIVEDNGGSDPLVGIVTLTYSVTYRTSPEAPGDLDEFITANALHQIRSGVADTAPSVDLFTVREP
jgi:hypothetical protein